MDQSDGEKPVARDELKGAVVAIEADFYGFLLYSAILLACIYNLDFLEELRNPWLLAVLIPLSRIFAEVFTDFLDEKAARSTCSRGSRASRDSKTV